ncbi:MAG: GGDEF domain-containing protein [Vitreoscilla sp.]|nr:GGDEF domain-containing protein [Burkholderiales bacterium]MBP6336141.1 GGDEF domain-containing protein [Vitreoscilla sp.]MBP7915469.1 GGDEF domain-containing protein [Vitreoscilla sp.]
MPSEPQDAETLPAAAELTRELLVERPSDRLPDRLPSLRFAGTHERDYLAFAFESLRDTRTEAYRVALALLLVFAAIDVFQATQDFVPLLTPAILAARLLAVAIVAWAQRRVRLASDWSAGHRWMRATGLSLGLMMLVSEALYCHATGQLQAPLIVAGNILMTMAFFFPLGYSFVAGLKIAVVFSLAACLVLPQFMPAAMLADFYRLLPFQLMGLAAAALAGYQQERTLRALFLMKQSVTQMASSDALTGLSNRHAFEPFVARAMQQAARDKQQVALVLLDVDQLKPYSDQFGNPAGDAALKALARAVSQRIRRQFDLGARLGGGEFALFFYDVNVGFAWTVAEDLRRDVAQRLAISHPDSSAGVLTISLGAAVSADGESFEGLYQRADQALYRAKAQGRNQVQLAE